MRPIKTLVFALALLPLGLFAADKKMAPPPPTFSFEASTDTAGVQAQPATPDQSVPQDATATAADAQLFGSGAPGSDDSALPAAPSISDEELISNSMEVAYQFYHAEDFVGASQACQQIVDRYPKKDILGTRYLLALCEEHNRTYPDALRQYAYIIKHQPKSTFANAAAFRIGLCHLALGRTEEAIRTFRDIIDFNPPERVPPAGLHPPGQCLSQRGHLAPGRGHLQGHDPALSLHQLVSHGRPVPGRGLRPPGRGQRRHPRLPPHAG